MVGEVLNMKDRQNWNMIVVTMKWPLQNRWQIGLYSWQMGNNRREGCSGIV